MTLLAAVALVVAIASLTTLWQMKREEQRRSDARVAALSAAVNPSFAGSSAFSGPLTTTNPLHPLLKVGLGFGVVLVAVATVTLMGMLLSRPAPHLAQPAALELLTMNHSRQTNSLTINGLVRNQSGQEADGVSAEGVVLDPGGNSVASVSAPIELQALPPGMSSRFTILVPGVSSVGRYRVSFRSGVGVIRHVDRRTPGAARDQGPGRPESGLTPLTPAPRTASHPAGS